MKRNSVSMGPPFVTTVRNPFAITSVLTTVGPVSGQYPNEVLRYIQPSHAGPVLYLGFGGPKRLGTTFAFH